LKKQAEEKKIQGNEAYKAKNFEEALKHYQDAIDFDNTDMTYYTNKAAVYYEMKEYDKCIEECDRAVEKSREGYYDFQKLGKALSRKANAKL
jgi:tetratricopeptide (TPR) repeat protein